MSCLLFPGGKVREQLSSGTAVTPAAGHGWQLHTLAWNGSSSSQDGLPLLLAWQGHQGSSGNDKELPDLWIKAKQAQLCTEGISQPHNECFVPH